VLGTHGIVELVVTRVLGMLLEEVLKKMQVLMRVFMVIKLQFLTPDISRNKSQYLQVLTFISYLN
jgi:hypothetical protein